MLMRGFVDAIMMRAQQAMALNNGGYLPPEHFDQIFSSHGTIMIFFMAMPFMTGLMNIAVPLQIGTRDVAFPFLNSLSLWLTSAGAALVMVSLVIGKFSTAGWTGYPPYSGIEYNPGVGVDYWIWALLISGVGSTLSGINFIVTILKRRAPGMGLMRMTPFTWTALCASVLMAFAFPALTVACGLLALDRLLGMHFFTNELGGNMMNYPNLFWIWGHPEVYILILPAFGVFSEVVSTFSRKRLFGYESLVYATAAIAILSFTVWLHHFFTMGSSANVNAFFGIDDHDHRRADRREGVQLAAHHVSRPHHLPSVDAVDRGLHRHLRHRRHDGRAAGHAAGRLPDAQHDLPGRALPQHDHPRRAVRLSRRLHVLVPQGLRLQDERAVGHRGLLVLDRRLLSRLHAALRAGLHGHAAPHGAVQRPDLAALADRGRRWAPSSS